MTFQPVRGTKDLLFAEYAQVQSILNTCFETSAAYGYGPIATPIFEFSEVFHRLGESSDVVAKETYSFEDRGGESMTLRPEGTAPVVRAVLSNGLTQNLPLKLSYAGPMFRYERPQKGRQRQFHQFGVEFMGTTSPLADAETILLGWQILKALGVDKDTRLLLNSLGCAESRQNYTEALVTYLKDSQEKLSPESLVRLQKNPLRVLDSKDPQDQEIVAHAPRLPEYWTKKAKDHFHVLCEVLEGAGAPYIQDPNLVRGLDYYGYTAFEFVNDRLGAQSAILSGGRYNGLSKDLGGPDISAIGWGMGIERIQLLTHAPELPRPLAYIIPLSDVDVQPAFSLAQNLREEALNVQMLYSTALKKQLKKASSLKTRFALLYGEQERQDCCVTVKDLDQGIQEKIAIPSLADYLIKKQAGAVQ